MGCGCGKGRQGTATVKERKRGSAGSAMISSQTTSAPTNTDYNSRLGNYLRSQQQYRRNGE